MYTRIYLILRLFRYPRRALTLHVPAQRIGHAKKDVIPGGDTFGNIVVDPSFYAYRLKCHVTRRKALLLYSYVDTLG